MKLSISIKSQLLLVILSAAVFALLSGAIVYLWDLKNDLRERQAQQDQTVARLVSDYSLRVMTFSDTSYLNRMLEKVHTIPEVKGVCVYDTAGRVFTSYIRQGASPVFPESPDELQPGFHKGFHSVVIRMEHKGIFYGTMCLKSSIEGIQKEFANQIGNLIPALIVILLFSTVTAAVLGQSVTSPILRLSKVISEIAGDETFNKRLITNRNDEIGQLYRHFNHLLEQIRIRDEQEKRAKEKLLKEEEKYRTLFENSLMGMFRMDSCCSDITEPNPMLLNVFGFDESNKKHFRFRFCDETGEKDFFDKIRRESAVEGLETNMLRADGEVIRVRISARLFEEKKEIQGVLEDISIQHRNLQDLEKANFELDSFIYHASHDLRAPLRSVIGLANIAVTEKSPDTVLHYIDLIRQTVEKLDRLVQDLLTLSRNNRMDNETSAIDFEEQVNECVQGLSYMDNAEKVTKKIQIDQEVPFVSDRVRINIILNNLISNAIKYQRLREADPFFRVRITVTEKQAVLQVEDNGEGISKGAYQRIFEMFRRESENSHGSGLGLYIVKNVVEKIKGSITLESEVGQGSTFTVVIPNLNKRAGKPAVQV